MIAARADLPGLIQALRQLDVSFRDLAPATRRTLAYLLPSTAPHRNPVEVGGTGVDFGRVVQAVAADPGVALVVAGIPRGTDAAILDSATRALQAATVRVVLVLPGMAEAAGRLRYHRSHAGVTSSATRWESPLPRR